MITKIFLTIGLVTFILVGTAKAETKLRLNHEAVKVRMSAERQIEVIETLQERLRLFNMLFPIQIEAVNKHNDNLKAIDTERIYKRMLTMTSSKEIFAWLLDFLSENEILREIIQNTFIQSEEYGDNNGLFHSGGTRFYVRWIWLYPSKNGLLFVAQDDMTQEIANEIWDTQILYPVYELHFPIMSGITQNPFWEKGVTKIRKAFPNVQVRENPYELVYTIFPGSSGIPNIIRRSIMLIE
ncbi:hypothetical protein FACS1894187_20740 [Synergistales bacterium]|nr:hypothetical protein FACS1894187_20740 [Synergistales bacterium]